MLIIDSHNLLFRKVFSANRDKPLDMKYELFKTLIMRETFYSIKKFKPTRLVFAIDSKHNWRKAIYPDYKHKRAKARQKSTVDFDKFFPIAEEFYADFKKTFTNFMFLDVDKCEGDDIIGVLTKKLKDNIIAISSDKDMNQLNEHPHYRQYNPMKREMVESLNPKFDLQIKILVGDKNDNIPAVKSRFGIVSATAAMADLTKFLDDNNLNDEYERNKTLIDLNLIPEEYKIKIMNEYNNYDVKPPKSRDIISFFTKHGLGVMFDEMQEIWGTLDNIG